MGYDVHVHRAEEWYEAEGTPITLEEWQAYVEASPDLRMDDFAEAETTDGALIRTEQEGIAVWTAHGQSPWFTWFEGAVVIKNPDEAMLRRAHEIASALGGRVQGDEGEFYDADGHELTGEPEPAAAEAETGKGKGLGRFFGRERRD